MGYRSTQELTDAARKQLASGEATSGMLYSLVQSDAAFADFQDAGFSVPVMTEPQMIPEQGIRIARELEQRFPRQTLHDAYGTVEANEGRILARAGRTQSQGLLPAAVTPANNQIKQTAESASACSSPFLCGHQGVAR